MSFYLLKSTFRREKMGDVLIDIDNVEAFTAAEKEMEDLANPIYVLRVSMKSSDSWKALFHTMDEVKEVIKEISGDRIDEKTLNNMLPQSK